MNTFTIRMGLVCPPLKSQLLEQGFVLKDQKHWQRRVDSICELSVLGILTESESRKAKHRFMQQMRRDIKAVKAKK